MGVFGWLRGSKPPAASGRVLPPDHVTRFDDQPIYRCCICGAGLGLDPDDSLHAEGPNRHLCGDCYRTREWDAIEEHEYFEHLHDD